MFEDYPVLAKSVRLENTGSAPVVLERAFSSCVDLPTMDLDMIHVYGEWNKENTTTRTPLRHGLQAVQSKRGMTGHHYNPMLVLAKHTATEEAGEAWGMNLIYSGNFSLEVEVNSNGCPRVLAGINPTDFRWRLEPGESFQTPEAVLVYSNSGLGASPHLPSLLHEAPVPQRVDF